VSMKVRVKDAFVTAHTTSTDSLLSPPLLEQRILHPLMNMLRAERIREEKLRKDRRIISGVRDVQEGEE